MARLSELWKQHKEAVNEGPMMVRGESWPKKEYYEFYFIDSDGWLHGVDDEHEHVTVNSNHNSDWQLYTEPKKRVERWLWVYVSQGKHVLNMHYMTEDSPQ